MWVAHITSHRSGLYHIVQLLHTHIPTHARHLAMSYNRANDLAWPGHGLIYYDLKRGGPARSPKEL